MNLFVSVMFFAVKLLARRETALRGAHGSIRTGIAVIAAMGVLLTACGEAGEGTSSARVISVADGDTLVVRAQGKDLRVRLRGIDAPEYDQPGGDEATQALRRLVDGRRVRMRTHAKDGYGRPLVDLYADGIAINQELVRRGHAWVYRRYTDDRDLLAAERLARADRVGVWAARDPVAPWRWRHRSR